MNGFLKAALNILIVLLLCATLVLAFPGYTNNLVFPLLVAACILIIIRMRMTTIETDTDSEEAILHRLQKLRRKCGMRWSDRELGEQVRHVWDAAWDFIKDGRDSRYLTDRNGLRTVADSLRVRGVHPDMILTLKRPAVAERYGTILYDTDSSCSLLVVRQKGFMMELKYEPDGDGRLLLVTFDFDVTSPSAMACSLHPQGGMIYSKVKWMAGPGTRAARWHMNMGETYDSLMCMFERVRSDRPGTDIIEEGTVRATIPHGCAIGEVVYSEKIRIQKEEPHKAH